MKKFKSVLAALAVFIIYFYSFWPIMGYLWRSFAKENTLFNILWWLLMAAGLVMNFFIPYRVYKRVCEIMDEKETSERLAKEEAERVKREAYKREEDLKRSIIEAKERVRKEFEEEAKTWSRRRINEEITELRRTIAQNRRMIRQNEREIERRERRSSYPGRVVENLEYGARQMEEVINEAESRIIFLKSLL